jgi:ABC-type Fe3+/spermidine/putrescine transport system ATPase subunit
MKSRAPDPRDRAGDRFPAIRVVDVERRFGQSKALAGVTLDVAEGEFFSLLGPSGSGKTTLLRIVGGFQEPDAGELLIAGRSMRGVPPERRPVNTVFQSYALFPTMSVAENVAYGLRIAGVKRAERRQRVVEALALVHMTELSQRAVGALSGGQAQRVALARALVMKPRVLLLDEPLGALDLQLRRAMQLELKTLQEQIGITFLFVTHDQEEAMTMSDRVGVMRDGLLEQVGTPSELYRTPSTAFVASFLGETNLLEVARDAHGEARLDGTPVASPHGDRTSTTWSLRPEAVRIGPDAAAQPVHLDARVEGVEFLGALTRFRVVLGLGDGGAGALRLRVLTTATDLGLAAGDATVVGWDPGEVVAVHHGAPEPAPEPLTAVEQAS